MSNALYDAVGMWLAHHAELPRDLSGEHGSIAFARTENGGVEWMSGRPDVTYITLDLLREAGTQLGWDGTCITMPGNLRYRPLFVTGHGDLAVRRVGP